ncbi:MAG: hypothetical protein WBH86_09035 [Thermogutta sp.]|nr:hypothetical protein [Thermogutta sp.]HOP76574.1 hypothetical protein [Thermogutta sp.]HPU05287.1 hypothetical protein [Thermogutta sp.]HQF12633.1 hypothetical protein [Thermogutta sp.]
MITLEQALRTRWQDDPTLAALLPVNYVWTNWSDVAQVPRAEITAAGEDRVWLTSRAEVAERVRVTVEVWHNSFEKLRSTINRIKELFDRASFDLGDNARILRLTYQRDDMARQGYGLWRGEITFDGLALRPIVA